MPIFGPVIRELRKDAMEQSTAEIERLKYELAQARAEIAAMRPVVEAAERWSNGGCFGLATALIHAVKIYAAQTQKMLEDSTGD